MNKIVLIIAAHPDDEVLGCGGTIAKHTNSGDCVHLLLMGSGIGSRKNAIVDEFNTRIAAQKKAMNILNISSTKILDYPDNKMDMVPLLEVALSIELEIARLKPSVVYTHSIADLNIDHCVTYNATLIACRPLPESSVKEIYAYEVPSSTGWTGPEKIFKPNLYVNITDYWDKKIAAIEAYDFEMRDFPHARSSIAIEALSSYRGSTAGYQKCEAFEVIRIKNA